MSGCACGGHGAGGPMSEGRELVEFVAQAHGGSMVNRPIPNGGFAIKCHGCGADLNLVTFVGTCAACGGVHAIAPPRSDDAANIQYAGDGFNL